MLIVLKLPTTCIKAINSLVLEQDLTYRNCSIIHVINKAMDLTLRIDRQCMGCNNLLREYSNNIDNYKGVIMFQE